MARSAVLLDVTLEGCDLELYVNDIPLMKVPAAAGGGMFQCDHVLVQGENVFEVLLHPGSTPSVARTEKRTLPSDGIAVEVRAALCPPGTVVAALGDDVTDEDLFAALPPTGLSFHVGTAPSRARLRLRSPEDVRELLETLAGPAG